jgi:H+/Cl- antiporter ClcA
MVTRAHFAHPWLLALLPLAGVFSVWCYRAFGRNAERGNNLIIDEIHETGAGVPFRMAPLVWAGTLLTHLCGGSSGREGTAVQMGGALADGVRRALRLGHRWQGMLLSAGVAGGFGAVFGTPVAGAVFALEVLVRGRIHYTWAGPCLVAALTGDWVCHALGAHHDDFATIAGLASAAGDLASASLWRVAVLGLIFGLAARFFVFAAHGVGTAFERAKVAWWLRPVIGGAAVGGLALMLGTDAYLGLGAWHPDPDVPSLRTMFEAGGATPWSWFWKLVFTVVTVGAGFKGGEVTPLFFIGAALGHVAGPMLGVPLELGAALGFAAVFAGATKTPLACTLLAMELFGGGQAGFFALACFASYLASGAGGLYKAQRAG